MQTLKGTVTFFNDAKGFGFLKAEGVEGDIFAHYSAIVRETKNEFQTLDEGQEVSFELTTGPKGPQAFNIKKLS